MRYQCAVLLLTVVSSSFGCWPWKKAKEPYVPVAIVVESVSRSIKKLKDDQVEMQNRFGWGFTLSLTPSQSSSTNTTHPIGDTKENKRD